MTTPEFKIHECEHLPKDGVQVICAWDFALREYSTWTLVIQRDATAADLEENAYLENEGDTLWFKKSVKVAQKIAGHVNPSTTLIYEEPPEEMIEDALKEL